MKTLTVPKGSPDPLPELAVFLEPFAPLFRRATSRRSLECYVTGLLTEIPRKNCGAIAEAVANTSLEQLQHLLTDAAWDPLALDEQRVRLLVEHSPANGMLVLDDTGLPKQGKASVGVQQQSSGTLGKQGNCQIVVSAEYVVDDPTTSQPLHWPFSARLYLPESWATDYAHCDRVHIPPAMTFASKPELALLLLDRATSWGVPFARVVTDAGYGLPRFLRALDERSVPSVCTVAHDFGIRLPAEMQQAVAEQAEIAPRKRGQPKKPRPARRHEAQAVTAAQPAEAWQTVEWREGSRGPLRKPFVARCASMRESAALAIVKRMGAVGADLKAGCLECAHFQARRVIPSGSSVPCPQTPHCLAWWNGRICAGRWNSSMRTPRVNAAWISFRDVVGMACIATWRSSCWPIPSCRVNVPCAFVESSDSP